MPKTAIYYKYYDCWQKARIALLILDIRSKKEYEGRYAEDSCLPINPETYYSEFPGWDEFFAKVELAVPEEFPKKAEPKQEQITMPKRYATWQEASAAVKRLGIRSWTQYRRRYQADPLLPSSINLVYEDYPGAEKFFGVKNVVRIKKDFYPTWQQAGKAAQKMGIESIGQYLRMYKKDNRLPSNPSQYYKDFSGWKKFLGVEEKKREKKKITRKKTNKYATWQKASKAAQKLGIKSSTEYIVKKQYKKDPLLPSGPNIFYPDFPGWGEFLGKIKDEQTKIQTDQSGKGRRRYE